MRRSVPGHERSKLRRPRYVRSHPESSGKRILRSDAFRSKLEPLGVIPTVLSGSAFAEFQRSELVKWGKAVRDSGATMN
jgi:hypothetical protein